MGPIKHNSEPAKFTWSIHCLYANAPGPLLEMLSLGSILVTLREQELNIQIPAFCCNSSDDDGERKKMIKSFLIRAQFEVSEYFEGILSINRSYSIVQWQIHVERQRVPHQKPLFK